MTEAALATMDLALDTGGEPAHGSDPPPNKRVVSQRFRLAQLTIQFSMIKELPAVSISYAPAQR